MSGYQAAEVELRGDLPAETNANEVSNSLAEKKSRGKRKRIVDINNNSKPGNHKKSAFFQLSSRHQKLLGDLQRSQQELQNAVADALVTSIEFKLI